MIAGRRQDGIVSPHADAGTPATDGSPRPPSGEAPVGGVVDSHVHVLPAQLAAKIRAFFEEHLPGPLVYGTEPRSIVARLGAVGVGTAWTLPYVHRSGMADGLNRSIADLSQELSKNGQVELVTGLTVHPADDDAAGVVARAVDDFGSRVLKLHCSVGDFSITDSRLAGVFAFAGTRGLPTVVHLGRSVTGRTAAPEFDGLAEVAARYRDVPFIIAHCGYPATRRAVELLHQYPNLYADLTPVVTQPVALDREDVEDLWPRLLFGSDAPNTGIDAGEGIATVRDRYSGTAAEAILGGNARRLLAAVRL